MRQLSHLVRIQPSAIALQRQADTTNFLVVSKADDSCYTKAARERLANEPMSSGASGGVRNAKSTRTLDGRGVETSEMVIAHYGHERFFQDLHIINHELVEELKAVKALSQSRDAELQKLSVQFLTIQENERQRIAADLHDGIGQSLSLVKLSMESAAQLLKTGAQRQAAESLEEVIHKVKDAIDELHRTAMNLHPCILDDLGIIPALSWFFREFEVAWRGKKIEKDISVAEGDVPAPLKGAIFRILQEAMCNIVKHADAGWIRVSLKKAGGVLQLSIEDNGRGFDPHGASARRDLGRGLGLGTMKERARSSDGTFEMKSTPGHGTRILVSWKRKDGEVEHRAANAACIRKR